MSIFQNLRTSTPIFKQLREPQGNRTQKQYKQAHDSKTNENPRQKAGESHITFRGAAIEMADDFSTEMMEARN